MPNILELLNFAKSELKAFDTRQIDAEILLAHTLGKSQTWLYTWPEKDINKQRADNFKKLVTLRKSGIPIAYITGHKEFYGFEFKVNKNTLLPRPETELLVKIAFEYLKPNGNILELGTGTGAIAICFAKKCASCKIIASDISDKALAVARDNCKTHKAQNVTLIQSDWFSSIKNKKFNLIVSNPPYVATTEFDLLNQDARHEPEVALFAGADGLDAIRKIIKESKNFLEIKGKIILEHGFSQAARVREVFAKHGFKDTKSFKDINGLERVTMAAL